MEHSTDFRFHAHRECANFSDGLCALSGAVVNPNGIACPNFTPKHMTATPQLGRPNPLNQQPRWLPLVHSSQPPSYSIQQFHYSPSYIPNFWEMYSYQIYPHFMYLWSPYEYPAYFMMSWLNVPSPYVKYNYPAYGYGYQPYHMFPPSLQFPPQSPDEELIMLEAYRRELQAEIEDLDERIRELRRWVEGKP